jgi:hypothetical protein
VTLPGKAPAWDYLTYDAVRSYLFIGRRHDGVGVFDVATHKRVATIANSQGANKAILVPQINRGFTVNGAGSTTVFNLATLKTIRRIHFGKNADAEHQRIFVGCRSDHPLLDVVNANTDRC